jgi:hypothetical protein
MPQLRCQFSQRQRMVAIEREVCRQERKDPVPVPRQRPFGTAHNRAHPVRQCRREQEPWKHRAVPGHHDRRGHDCCELEFEEPQSQPHTALRVAAALERECRACRTQQANRGVLPAHDGTMQGVEGEGGRQPEHPVSGAPWREAGQEEHGAPATPDHGERVYDVRRGEWQRGERPVHHCDIGWVRERKPAGFARREEALLAPPLSCLIVEQPRLSRIQDPAGRVEGGEVATEPSPVNRTEPFTGANENRETHRDAYQGGDRQAARSGSSEPGTTRASLA